VFLHPLGLLALLAVPAVVAFHLFRRRFRPHPVSAIFLWESRDRIPRAGPKIERLRSNPSFWLETAAAAFLGLAFAGPRGFAGGEETHLVAVLDTSASMGAQVDGVSARDRAVDLVRDRIDALSPRSRVTIVRSGSPPTLLAGPAAYPTEATSALAAFAPSANRHDLSPAAALALQLSGGGSVLLVTDRLEPEALPPEVEIAAVGRAASNLAITHAARTRSASGEDRIALAVTSFSTERTTARVRLLAGRESLAERAFEIDPDERRHLLFEVPHEAPAIEALLDGDALALDDRAFLAPVAPRTVALATTLDEAGSRLLGLFERSRIDRWLALVPESVEAPDPAAAHAVLGRIGGSPWFLSLETPGAERKEWIGPFLVEKRHPLLEGVTLEGVVWSADPSHRLEGAPLVSAGDEPLLTESREGSRVLFRANLDPSRSTLQRSPDWPILLSNFAEIRRRELPGPARTNLLVGETLVVRGDGEATYVVEGEGRRVEYATRGTLVADAPDRPGLYRVSRDGAPLCEIGVTFADPAESDLRALGPGARSASASAATVAGGSSGLRQALLGAVLLALVLDWLFLARAHR